ncbi:MAG: hypothetical protein J0L96_04625 [Anaerolineae bacterium]|nr:hypothetical protein [Anaerolineae bacterium]
MNNGKTPDRKKALLRILLWLVILIILFIYLYRLFPEYVTELNKAFSSNISFITAIVMNIGGVVFGVIVNIFIEWLSTRILGNRYMKLVAVLNNLAENVQSSFESIAQSLRDQIDDQSSKFVEIITSFSIDLSLFTSNILVSIINAPPQFISSIVSKLRAQKWYHQKGAIDPGLIEVSLAVTAVIVASPSIIETIFTTDFFLWLRFIAEAVSIFTSISLLNLYSRDKGAVSHILIAPFENGPFFFLGWSIILGLVILGTLIFIPASPI